MNTGDNRQMFFAGRMSIVTRLPDARMHCQWPTPVLLALGKFTTDKEDRLVESSFLADSWSLGRRRGATG